jgi:hypothetical protein
MFRVIGDTQCKEFDLKEFQSAACDAILNIDYRVYWRCRCVIRVEGMADFFVVMVKASPGTHNRWGGRR